MALDVLAQGRIVERPRRRIDSAGDEYVTSRAVVGTYEDSVLVGLITHNASACDALLGLDIGDSVAFTGQGTVRSWEDKKTGKRRIGLSVVVMRVLTVYPPDEDD